MLKIFWEGASQPEVCFLFVFYREMVLISQMIVDKKNKSGCFCALRTCQPSWSGRSSSQPRCKGLSRSKRKGPMSTCTPRGEWWEIVVSFIRYDDFSYNLTNPVFWKECRESLKITSLLHHAGLSQCCLNFSLSHVSQKHGVTPFPLM